MQAVFNSYTKAFNSMYNRSGTLFEERFKAIHIDKDSYLLHIYRYIHRNPIDAGLVDHLEDWPYSNYPEWIGKRPGTLIDNDFVKENFSHSGEYERFVLDYSPPKEQDKEMKNLLIDDATAHKVPRTY